MAIIECLECNRPISNKAVACPGCGAPVVWAKKAVTWPFNKWISAALVCVLLLGAFNYYSTQKRAFKKEQARLEAVQRAAVHEQLEAARKRREAAATSIARAKSDAAERAERQRRNEEYAKEEVQRQRKLETARGVVMLVNQLKTLNEINQVASATPRIALSPQVVRLQALMRETEALPITGCLVLAHHAAVEGMRELTQAYLSFMRQDSNDMQVNRSVKHLKASKEQMDACAMQSGAGSL